MAHVLPFFLGEANVLLPFFERMVNVIPSFFVLGEGQMSGGKCQWADKFPFHGVDVVVVEEFRRRTHALRPSTACRASVPTLDFGRVSPARRQDTIRPPRRPSVRPTVGPSIRARMFEPSPSGMPPLPLPLPPPPTRRRRHLPSLSRCRCCSTAWGCIECGLVFTLVGRYKLYIITQI